MLCRAGRSLVAKISSSLGSDAASGNRPRLLRSSSIVRAIPTCLRFDLHSVRRAASRAACTAGRRRPTSRPMIAITTSSSTSVKAAVFRSAAAWRRAGRSRYGGGEMVRGIVAMMPPPGRTDVHASFTRRSAAGKTAGGPNPDMLRENRLKTAPIRCGGGSLRRPLARASEYLPHRGRGDPLDVARSVRKIVGSTRSTRTR